MRKVKVYRWGHIEASGDEPAGKGKIFEGCGMFHQWGLECAEEGNFSMGIVEMVDGIVKLYEPYCIEFVEPLYMAFYGEEGEQQCLD